VCTPPNRPTSSAHPTTRIQIANGVSIGSAVFFAQVTTERPDTLRWAVLPPHNCPFPWGSGPHVIHDSLSRQPKRHFHWFRCFLQGSLLEERQHWTECTECAWRSGKLVSGQRNGRSPHSSHFPRKVTLNSVKTTEQLPWFPMQARYFSASYWKGSE